MYHKVNNIHLIGIGGIGMSGLAQLLAQNGYRVSGSDIGRTETVRLLEEQGMRVHFGHDPSHLNGAELVVYSSAIRPDNPERMAAHERGILAVTRAEMLAEVMRLKHGVAVAGAHGKTTTTSMVGVALVHAGWDPTVVVGGRVDNFGGTNARLGKGEFIVVEADESDGSFERLSPSVAVITNLDREHLDHYGSMELLEDAFVRFANKVPFYGLVVMCADDPYLERLEPLITRRRRTYGFGPNSHYRIGNYQSSPLGSVFDVKTPKGTTRISLQVSGRHNALNAVAALAVADELGVDTAVTTQALSGYRGVARRFQHRGELRGVHFFDDYAHHPTEIQATLQAARERFPQAKIRVVFQPHRFSRFKDLWEAFAASFDLCDGVAISDVYAAGEAPIEGVSSDHFARLLAGRLPMPVHRIQNGLEGIDRWMRDSSPGDVILTLGAGDLPNVYKNLF